MDIIVPYVNTSQDKIKDKTGRQVSRKYPDYSTYDREESHMEHGKNV